MKRYYDCSIIEESIDYINIDADFLKRYLYEYLLMLEVDKDILIEAAVSDSIKNVNNKVNNFVDQKISSKFVGNTLITKKSIVGYFIQLIQKIIEVFQNNVHRFYKIYNAWLKNVSQNIDSVNFDDLSIKADPMFILGQEADKAFISKLSNRDPLRYANRLKDFKGTLDQDYLLATDLTKYLDEEGSLAGGLKNHMRYQGRTKGSTPQTFTGDKLRKITEIAIDYCLKYEDRLKFIQAYSNRVKSKLKDLENRIARENINVDGYYSLIGECFMLYENGKYSVDVDELLLEAEMYSKTNSNTNNSAPKTDQNINKASTNASSSPKVEVGASSTDGKGNGNSVNTKDTKTGEESTSGQFDNMDSQTSRIMKAEVTFQQILIGAFLTVSEERYNNYIKICKYVFSNTKFKFREENVEKNDMNKSYDNEAKGNRSNIFNRTKDKIADKIGKK